jgi:hypothetical protein
MQKPLFCLTFSLVFLFSFSLCTLLISCTKSEGVPDPAPSVYYWRTTLNFDSAEINFLKAHKIGKIYLRYFDVALNDKGNPVPVGTIKFSDTIPAGIKVIPVVYIEPNCISNPNDMATKIVKRVKAMSEANGINTDELQIDCDWTISSQKNYFAMLTAMRRLFTNSSLRRLSATIRLHQLSMAVPPVDYGVLMCYNTGNLKNEKCENSILSPNVVKTFLKPLHSYKLPLCAAYPAFSWHLLFHNGEFQAILRGVDMSNHSLYKMISPGKFLVISSHSIPSPDPDSFGLMLNAGEEIKVDEVSASLILNVKAMLEEARPSIGGQVIIYNLNSNDLAKYKSYEISKIYSH